MLSDGLQAVTETNICQSASKDVVFITV